MTDIRINRGVSVNRRAHPLFAGRTPLAVSAVAAAMLLISGCTRELDLFDFEEDFLEYEPQIKVEAEFKLPEGTASVVRVDRTMTLSDSLEFLNGLDDDGDWDPEKDDVGTDGIGPEDEEYEEPDEDGTEGNGVPDPGEPHVDELDELIRQVHVMDADLTLYNGGAPLCSFTWSDSAGRYREGTGFFRVGEGDPVVYGGYIPDGQLSLSPGENYSLVVAAASGDTLEGWFTPPAPPELIFTPADSVSGDTLFRPFPLAGTIEWVKDPSSLGAIIVLESFVPPDSTAPLFNAPAFFDLMSFYGILPGLYRVTVSSFEENFFDYYYTTLPVNHPERSSISGGLGFAGALAETIFFLRIY